MEGNVDPVRDIEIIHEELRLKDVEMIAPVLDKLEKTAVRGNDKKLKPEYVSGVSAILLLSCLDLSLCITGGYSRLYNLLLLASGYHVEGEELGRGGKEPHQVLPRVEREGGKDLCVCSIP